MPPPAGAASAQTRLIAAAESAPSICRFATSAPTPTPTPTLTPTLDDHVLVSTVKRYDQAFLYVVR